MFCWHLFGEELSSPWVWDLTYSSPKRTGNLLENVLLNGKWKPYIISWFSTKGNVFELCFSRICFYIYPFFHRMFGELWIEFTRKVRGCLIFSWRNQLKEIVIDNFYHALIFSFVFCRIWFFCISAVLISQSSSSVQKYAKMHKKKEKIIFLKENRAFFNSCTAITGTIIGLLLVFYNSKNLNFIGALSFFKDLFTHFHDFLSQFAEVILVKLKQEMERKSEWFGGVKFFLL